MSIDLSERSYFGGARNGLVGPMVVSEGYGEADERFNVVRLAGSRETHP